MRISTWSALRNTLLSVCWRSACFCLLIRILPILPTIWKMWLRSYGSRLINWASRVKKPAVMRYAICGELRDFFITGLMFPIRLQHPGIVFGIRGMPAKSLWRIVTATLTVRLSFMRTPRNWKRGVWQWKNWWTTILHRLWSLRKNIWKPWNRI